MLKTPSGFALRQPSLVMQRASTTPNMVLTTDPSSVTNGVRILTDVGGINGLTGKVQIVSGSTVQDHNRVQIVAGMQNPSTMSLTEQQQRVQIVTAGVPDISSMSLTTEQQNHVQILTSVPNSTAEVSLTEQQQNRMEIISSVPNTTAVNEQKSRIQVIPNTRTVSLTEQLVSDISQQILTNVPNTSNIHEQNTRVIFQNNSERNNEHLHISSSERTDVHITANTLPDTIANQQAKLQMIANLPQNCAISLNEQNRFQIIPNAEYTVDDKTHLNDVHKLKHLQLETATTADTSQPVDGQQRFHVISNLEEQQRFMRVNEEHDRIIVEHQRVLNTSTMSFNEQQNRIQVVSNSGGAEQQQRLIQQLEEQRKIQIITQLPQQQQQLQPQQQQQQRIMQLNEHQKKVTVKSLENFQEQLQQSIQQQRLQQMSVNPTQQQLHKLTVPMKDVGVQKLNHMPCISSELHDKLPDSSSGESAKGNSTAGGEDGKPNNQNTSTVHRVSVDGLKSRASAYEGRMQNVNSAHQTYKPVSRNTIACSPSSVISPRCSPSPHSPFSSKSPSHHSPQSPIVATPNVINSCFTNRPNLTVVAQSSPPSISTNNSINQNLDSSPALMPGKPCAAVISHSAPHTNVVVEYAKTNFDGQPDTCSTDRFAAPSIAVDSPGSVMNEVTSLNNGLMTSSPPTAISQNSFLDAITHSHPNISINKTGIVQPCATKPNVMRGKKPKKSAVVKPMVFQSEDKEKNNDGPACLNPVAIDETHSSVVQRVQTIQLTPQKQQVPNFFPFLDYYIPTHYTNILVLGASGASLKTPGPLKETFLKNFVPYYGLECCVVIFIYRAESSCGWWV